MKVIKTPTPTTIQADNQNRRCAFSHLSQLVRAISVTLLLSQTTTDGQLTKNRLYTHNPGLGGSECNRLITEMSPHAKKLLKFLRSGLELHLAQ